MKNLWYKSKWFQWLLRAVLLTVALYLISLRWDKPLIEAIENIALHQAPLWISCYILLWILNFWMDIKLWQNAVMPIASLTRMQAFADNLKFYSYSFVSPGNTGGLLARLRRFKSKGQLTAASLCSAKLGIVRYLARLSIGLSAGILFLPIDFSLSGLMVAFTLGFFLVITFFWAPIINYFPWKAFLERIDLLKMTDVPKHSDNRDNLPLLYIMASLKFLAYCGQLIFLLLLFGMPFQMELLYAVPVFFLISSLIPSFPAFDFIIKGAIGMAAFQYFDAYPAIFLLATTLLWGTNWAFPALVGLMLNDRPSTEGLKTPPKDKS